MYSEIFHQNFILNFLTSSLFILFNIFFSISIKDRFTKIFKINFQNFNIIICFYLVFLYYSFFFNLFFLLGLHTLIPLFFYLSLIIQFLIVFVSFNKNYIFLKKKNFNKNLLIIFLIFYLISILPISDADSIFIHLNFPIQLINGNFNNLSIFQTIEFSTFSNSEIILVISSLIKSDNFGSQLNLATLIIFYFCLKKQKNSFSWILLSCPIIIFLISTQKLQLFFGILYLVVFIIIHEREIIIRYKNNLTFAIILLAFYSTGKFTYIIFSFILFGYLFYLNKQKRFYIIIQSIIIFSAVYVPLLLLKYKLFANPIAPFADSFFNDGRYIYDNFVNKLRTSEGWINNYKDFTIYIRPFIPLSITQLSSSLGLIFLIMLLDLKLLKKLYFIPLIMIFLILLTGQILPRYYLESFLILAYFFDKNRLLINKIIINLQILVLVLFSLYFCKVSYFDNKVIMSKENFLKNFAFTYIDAEKLDKLNLKGNILISSNRFSIFYGNNIFPSRIFFDMNKVNDSIYLDFIEKNKIKYVITSNKLSDCIKYEVKNNFKFELVTRNFFRSKQYYYSPIYEIKYIRNKCK